MNHSAESSENFKAVIGIMLSAAAIFLFVWFMRSLPPPSEESNMTPGEAAQYDRYQSEQLQYEDGPQEACIEQAERDIERYGEWTADTYDCTK